MSGEPVKIQLGDHEIDCYPQRHAYLTNRFGRFVEALVNEGESVTGESIARFLGERAYDALAVLIPKLADRIPRYEFMGFGDQAAWDEKTRRDVALHERGKLEEKLRNVASLEDRELTDEERGQVDAFEVPADPYDDARDRSPDFPQIAEAFEVAVRVNRFDALKVLGGIVDPTLLRQLVNQQLLAAISRGSASLPSTNGGSASTSSGAMSPTSTESADSPSLASNPSHTSTEHGALVS